LEIIWEGATHTSARKVYFCVVASDECGINISAYNDYQEGDIIECFEIEEQRPSLN